MSKPPVPRLNVGDVVRLLPSGVGASYSGYTKWAIQHNLTAFKTNSPIPANEEYEVVCIAPHSKSNNNILAGLQATDGQQYIMGLDDKREHLVLVSKVVEKETRALPLGKWGTSVSV